jgi:23S rRNA pseudouridine1911/1915/1917 synthase
MPSKNMLPKGKRRQSVKKEYREQRTLAQEREAAARAKAEELGEPMSQNRDMGHPDTIETSDFMEHEPTLEERIATNDWFTTKGASGSKVAEETYDEPRYANPYAKLKDVERAEIQVIEDLEPEDGVRSFTAPAEAAGMRIDAYLAKALPEVSRARVQLLIENGQATVDGKPAKSKLKLKGGELIEIEGEPTPEPLHAVAEDIPLSIVYEDDDLAVIDKAAGMMVHAGSGSGEHNRGTLVNALLHRFGAALSSGGGTDTRYEIRDVNSSPRPGIVHRLDKQTSGLIVVAKNDVTHRTLSEMFAGRQVHKTYVALVHGWMVEDEGTIALPIARDAVRRIRMTTRRAGGRSAISHWKVLERIDGAWGKFTLVEVRIETGRTHQIRVHLQAKGHPVVGDYLYGAPHALKRAGLKSVEQEDLALARNFLHAQRLELMHPRTGEPLQLRAELPAELAALLERVRGQN